MDIEETVEQKIIMGQAKQLVALYEEIEIMKRRWDDRELNLLRIIDDLRVELSEK